MQFFRLIILFYISTQTLFAQTDGLYGTWESFEKKERILFILNKDGSGSFDGIAFSYKVEEKEIIATFDYGVFNYDFELKGPQLILKEGNLEHPYIFNKIKGASEVSKPISKPIDPMLLGTWVNASHSVTFNSDGSMLADGKKSFYEAKNLRLKIFSGNQLEENAYSVYQDIISIALNGEVLQLKKQETTNTVPKK